MSATTKIPLSGAVNQLLADKQDGLSVRQLKVILECAKEPQTCRGLSAKMGISRPAVTRAFDRLETEKLGRRIADPSDKRSILFELTAKGKKEAQKYS